MTYLTIVILRCKLSFNAKAIILKQYLEQKLYTCAFLIILVVQKEPQLIILESIFYIVPLRGYLYLLRMNEIRMATRIIGSVEQGCFDQFSVCQRNLTNVESCKHINGILTNRFIPNKLHPLKYRVIE